MKWEKGWKRAACVLAAVTVCLNLAGCGQTKENTTAAKEFVYVPEYQALEGEEGYPEQMKLIGDTIYYISGIFDEKTQIYSQYLCSLKVGETTPVRTKLEIGENTNISQMCVTPEGGFQLVLVTSVYEEVPEAAEEEASGETKETDEKTENAEEADGEAADGETEDTEAPEEVSQPEAGESTVVISSGGSMMTSSASAVSYSTGADYSDAPVSQKIELRPMAVDGTLGQPMDISSIFPAENAYVQYMEMDSAGNMYLSMDQGVKVIDKDGKELFEITVDNWINNMFSTKDGTVMLVYYGSAGMEIHPIDLTKKAVGEAEKNLMISQYGNYIFSKGSDSDLLFSTNNTLYSYNFGDEKPSEILKWIDCDINSNDIRSFTMLEDGRILVVSTSHEEDTSKTELAYLTKKKGSEVPEKKILTFATMSLDYEMNKQVIKFNKTNQEYRMEVKEYMTDDYRTGLTQFNADISGGNCPDIIDLSFGSMRKYAAKGILEDLYPFIDNDSELNREDYLPNILKAYETDGKLYALTPLFYINTVMAKVSVVGEKSRITSDELRALAESLPEDTELMEYATKSSILFNEVMMNPDRYVNWTTGECKFNSEEFIKSLEFANTFKKEANYNEEGPNMAEKLHDDKLIMVDSSISSVQDYQMYDAMFGEPIAFIGVPTDRDNGSTIGGAGSVLGMSSKGKNKDGAWQFIRIGITKERQETQEDGRGWGFPIMKSALEAQFETDMTKEYYEDENGNQAEQVKTSRGYNNFNVEIYAATQEQVDIVRKLIESVDTLYEYDPQIYDIISEETTPFFEGQKPAKDVAGIIQSRIQIYVNENR